MGLFGRTKKGQYYPKDPMRLGGNNRTGGTGNALTRLTGRRIQSFAETQKEKAKLKGMRKPSADRNILDNMKQQAKTARKESMRVAKARVKFEEINDPNKTEEDLQNYRDDLVRRVFTSTNPDGSFRDLLSELKERRQEYVNKLNEGSLDAGQRVNMQKALSEIDEKIENTPQVQLREYELKNQSILNRWEQAQMLADSIDSSSETQRDEKLKYQKKADDILKTAMNDEDKDILDILRNRLVEYWGNTYSRRATPEQRKYSKSALGQDMPSSGGKLLESGMDEVRVSRYTPEQLDYFASLLGDREGKTLEKLALDIQKKKTKELDKMDKKFGEKLDRLEKQQNTNPSPETQKRIALVISAIDQLERQYKMREQQFDLEKMGLLEKTGYIPESRKEQDDYVREFGNKLKSKNRTKEFKEFVPPTAEDMEKRRRILARYGGRRRVSIDQEI
jgi:hypothetical protein